MSESINVVNPELKAKLETLRIKESDPDLEMAACDLIASEATFLSVVKAKADSTPENPKFDFPMITTTGHGYIFYPVFTDMEELIKWNKDEDVQVVALTFDNYAEMILQDSKITGMVINPQGANYSMDRELVDYLKTQKAFFGKLAIEQMFNQENTEGPQLSDPAPYPTEMAEALKKAMAMDDSINRAFLRLMKNEGETSYLVILDAAEGKTTDDYLDVTDEAMDFVTDMYLDLMVLDSDFAKKAVEGVEPFYTKQ